VTLAKVGTAVASATRRVTFKFVDASGKAQVLPYTCLFLGRSYSQLFTPKIPYPTDFIFGLGAGTMTPLLSGKERWSISRHAEVPAVVNCWWRTVDFCYGTACAEATWKVSVCHLTK